jgi:hypothetical protein
MRKTTTTLLFLCAMTATSVASAHISLTSPPARHPDSEQKFGPCGVESGDARSTDPAKITTYTAGETITVTWTEMIDHDPAHYRIAFSREGDAFADPLGFDDAETVYPELLDGIPDADAGSGQQYSIEVSLPNEPCDLCSLQLIQVMHDKPPWGPEGGDDIYYQCADIVLLEDPNNPPGDPDPTDPPTGVGGTPPLEGAGGTDSGSGGQIVSPGAGGAPAAGGAAAGTGGTDPAPSASGGTADPGVPGQPGTTEDPDGGGDGTSSDGGTGADEAAGGCNFKPSAARHPLFAALLLTLVLGARRRRRAATTVG